LVIILGIGLHPQEKEAAHCYKLTIREQILLLNLISTIVTSFTEIQPNVIE
jgi:hypothetical protein